MEGWGQNPTECNGHPTTTAHHIQRPQLGGGPTMTLAESQQHYALQYTGCTTPTRTLSETLFLSPGRAQQAVALAEPCTTLHCVRLAPAMIHTEQCKHM